MRVALIAREIPDFAVEFADLMADYCDLLLCMPDRYYPPNRPHLKPRLELALLPWPGRTSFRNVAFIYKLAKRVREWKPDLVHFLSANNHWFWLLVLLLKPIPIVTTVHDVKCHPGDVTSRRVPRFYTNLLIRRSDAIIVHGERLRDDASGFLPIFPEKIFVAPLISSLLPNEFGDQGRQVRVNNGSFRLLFFGRIYEYKGLNYLLEAMRAVHALAPNVRLTIAGKGEDISKYTDSIGDLSNIEIRNWYISRPEMWQLFVEADLVVLPYIEASQSGPLMIAMAFGKPVVATDVGAISEVVRSAQIGLVVPPQDVAALATAIIDLALNDEARERFSRNAEKAMKNEYSKSCVAAQYVSIYRHLITSSGKIKT